MGRVSFALTSLTAAVPAGILGTIIVMEGFLKHVGEMKGLLLILASATLGMSAFVVLIPFGIMVFGGAKKKKPAAAKPGKGDAEKADDEVSAEAVVEESEADVDVLSTSGEAQVLDSDEDMISSGEIDAEFEENDVLGDTTAFDSPIGEEVELDDEESLVDADLDDFGEVDAISDEVILEDEEEDDAPKKKKKR